jgi:hypothetical protein
MTLATGTVIDLSWPNLWVDLNDPVKGQDGIPDVPAAYAQFTPCYAGKYPELLIGPYFGYVYA